MYKTIFAVMCLIGMSQSTMDVKPKDLLCDICVDVVTDLDEWITSDSTEQEIVEFVEGVS